MPLFAITREMGSLGIDVAQNIAKELNIPLIHHEVIDAVADKMRVRKSHVVRLLNEKTTLFDRLTSADTASSLFTASEIFDLACKPGGAVLRGWGAAFLLRAVPHAICARICAPLPLRTKRMMERLNSTDGAQVAQEIRLNDEAHTAVVRRNFDADSRDADHYDIVLNTERLSVDDATQELLALARRPVFQETDASRQVLQDLRLGAHIRVALRVNPPTRGVIVGTQVANGVVKLTGIVKDEDEIEDVIAVVKRQEGTKSVESELRTMHGNRPRGSG